MLPYVSEKKLRSAVGTAVKGGNRLNKFMRKTRRFQKSMQSAEELGALLDKRAAEGPGQYEGALKAARAARAARRKKYAKNRLG